MKTAVLVLALTGICVEVASAIDPIVEQELHVTAESPASTALLLPTTAPTIPSSSTSGGGLGGLGSVPGIGALTGAGNPGYNGQSLTTLGSASNSIAGWASGVTILLSRTSRRRCRMDSRRVSSERASAPSFWMIFAVSTAR